MSNQIFSYDAATGDLYENGQKVGTLATANSGAWLRLVTAANHAHTLAGVASELLFAQRAIQHPSDYLPGGCRRRLNDAQQAVAVATAKFKKEVA